MARPKPKMEEGDAIENDDSVTSTEPKGELVVMPPAPKIIEPTPEEIAEIDPEKERIIQQEMADELRREDFIRGRFEMMEKMVREVLYGDCKALIISGPAGVGKTWTVQKLIRERDNLSGASEGKISRLASGSVTDIALLGWLHKYRDPECVLALDDIDEIFDRTRSLNYLKAACDAFGPSRQISAGSSKAMKDEDGLFINSPFNFEGGIIFITNVPMELPQNAGVRLSKRHVHLQALKDRCEYVNLMPYDNKYRATRINMVVEEEGMLDKFKFTTEEQASVIDYFFDRFDQLDAPSLRTLLKIAMKVRPNPGIDDKTGLPNWQRQCDKLYLRPV